MHIVNFSQYFIRNLRTGGEEFGVDSGQGNAASRSQVSVLGFWPF